MSISLNTKVGEPLANLTQSHHRQGKDGCGWSWLIGYSSRSLLRVYL